MRLARQEPFALLVGFAIDQQVTVQKAFAGPYVLKERAGTLDPRKLAAMDPAEAFATKPAIHRFPGAMAQRVRDLAGVVADEYDGDAARIGRTRPTRTTCGSGSCAPRFGEIKIKSLSAVLAKQFGVKAAEEIAPDHPTLGDVTSPEDLDRYQTWKRAYKKAARGA